MHMRIMRSNFNTFLEHGRWKMYKPKAIQVLEKSDFAGNN